MEKQKQDYRHQQQVASGHRGNVKHKMHMRQRVCFEKPSIKSCEEIIEDENCSDTSRHIKEKVDVIVQDSISAINDKYLLDKQRKHQDKRDDGRK